MKPDVVSNSPAAAPRAPWRDAKPVHADGCVYTVDDMYEHGLAGRTLGAAAEAVGARPAALRDVLAEHPSLQQAYDAGWADREGEALRRAELALAEQAEGYWREVERVSVHKGVLTRYRERVFFPGSPAAATVLLERRDRGRWGKDVRPESPVLGSAALERVSLYLMEKGLGAVRAEGVSPGGALGDGDEA